MKRPGRPCGCPGARVHPNGSQHQSHRYRQRCRRPSRLRPHHATLMDVAGDADRHGMAGRHCNARVWLSGKRAGCWAECDGGNGVAACRKVQRKVTSSVSPQVSGDARAGGRRANDHKPDGWHRMRSGLGVDRQTTFDDHRTRDRRSRPRCHGARRRVALLQRDESRHQRKRDEQQCQDQTPARQSELRNALGCRNHAANVTSSCLGHTLPLAVLAPLPFGEQRARNRRRDADEYGRPKMVEAPRLTVAGEVSGGCVWHRAHEIHDRRKHRREE
jgi:hypothetical protein